MTVTTDFSLPSSPATLSLSKGALFISFIASKDPATGQSWCPDVRAAMPHLETAFAKPESPEMAIVEVGQKPEWRDQSNVFRTKWNVNSVPTLARFELVDGQVKETGRLTEGEILDAKRLQALIEGN